MTKKKIKLMTNKEWNTLKRAMKNRSFPTPEIKQAPKVPDNFLKPIQDRIILSAEKPETRSAGGIIIPDEALEQQTRGYVMAVGPWVGRNQVKIKVGDLVTYAVDSENYIDHDGIEYIILRENDIHFILN